MNNKVIPAIILLIGGLLLGVFFSNWIIVKSEVVKDVEPPIISILSSKWLVKTTELCEDAYNQSGVFITYRNLDCVRDKVKGEFYCNHSRTHELMCHRFD